MGGGDAVPLWGVIGWVSVIPGEFVRALGGGGGGDFFAGKMLRDLVGEGMGFRKFEHGEPPG